MTLPIDQVLPVRCDAQMVIRRHPWRDVVATRLWVSPAYPARDRNGDISPSLNASDMSPYLPRTANWACQRAKAVTWGLSLKR